VEDRRHPRRVRGFLLRKDVRSRERPLRRKGTSIVSESQTEHLVLVEATDDDFGWILGERDRESDLSLPEGGVDDLFTLGIVRTMTARLHDAGVLASWMVVCDGQVIGLCSYRRPPTGGRVEIGYGIAPSKRGKGYSTRVVAAMIEAASLDPLVDTLTAETATGNVASQRALERNGFERTGTRHDAEDGEVIVWAKTLHPS
jgi:RimJ/RimL family protein N-acetyltransferase